MSTLEHTQITTQTYTVDALSVTLSSDCGAYVVRLTEDTEHGSVLLSVRSSQSLDTALSLYEVACLDARSFARASRVLTEHEMI